MENNFDILKRRANTERGILAGVEDDLGLDILPSEGPVFMKLEQEVVY